MPLSKSYFYNGMVRKYVTGFGDMFTNIFVERKDGNESVRHRERVPLTYAPKEKFIQRIFQDDDLERSIAIKLPRMSFEITGFTYASERKITSKRKYKYEVNPNTVKYHYNPVPYDIDFSLYIAAKTQEEGLQIVEQIIPFFTPDYTIALNLVDPNVLESWDIPISLIGVSPEDSYDGTFDDRRAVIWTLSFMAKGYFIGPIRQQGLIEHAIVNTIIGEYCGDDAEHYKNELHLEGEEGVDAQFKHLCKMNAQVTINYFDESQSEHGHTNDEEGVLPNGTLLIIQGTNFDYVLVVESQDGTPFDLRTWTTRSQMRTSYDSDVAYDFNVTPIYEQGGKISLSMEPEYTDNIPPGYYIFDVEIENEDGYVLNVAEGTVYVKPQITR